MINPLSFYVVQGWMLTELGLKGNALAVYALIYGFSQDNNGEFTGSAKYLAEWTGASKKTILSTLASLTELGHISKKTAIKNGVTFCSYSANTPPQIADVTSTENLTPPEKKFPQGGEEITPGVVKKFPQGGEKITPNNIEDNIDKNIEDKDRLEGDIVSPPAAPAASPPPAENAKKNINYQAVADLYNSVCVSLPQVTSLSENRKKAIRARLNHYGMDKLKIVFEKAQASAFLTGKNPRNWVANFDWLIKDANMAKVLDGNFDDKKPTRQEAVPSWATGEAERAAMAGMRKLHASLTCGEDPELAARAERLRQSIQGEAKATPEKIGGKT